MPALHVAQINFQPVPDGLAPGEIFEKWPSLADIAEAGCAVPERGFR
jgi:hypothetical protein